MMTYAELVLAFQKCSTILQKATEAKKYIGAEIDITSTLKDVGLYTISTQVYMINNAYGNFWADQTKISYDKEKFSSSLINFKQFDEVKIVAKIRDISCFEASTPFFDLFLVSIEKQKPVIAQEPIKSDSTCFVATACYGDYNTPEVLILRKFRDEKLLNFFWGKVFVKFYYSVSPFFASIISNSDRLKKIVRQYFLEPIIQRLQQQNK